MTSGKSANVKLSVPPGSSFAVSEGKMVTCDNLSWASQSWRMMGGESTLQARNCLTCEEYNISLFLLLLFLDDSH